MRWIDDGEDELCVQCSDERRFVSKLLGDVETAKAAIVLGLLKPMHKDKPKCILGAGRALHGWSGNRTMVNPLRESRSMFAGLICRSAAPTTRTSSTLTRLRLPLAKARTARVIIPYVDTIDPALLLVGGHVLVDPGQSRCLVRHDQIGDNRDKVPD